jgi:hypothetical protein
MVHLNFQIETNKILKFKKDTISPMDFIRRVEDDLAKSSSWTDETMYHHFKNAHRGTAHKWLFSMTDMETEDSTSLTWSYFKDQLMEEFATQTGGVSQFNTKHTNSNQKIDKLATTLIRMGKTVLTINSKPQTRRMLKEDSRQQTMHG